MRGAFKPQHLGRAELPPEMPRQKQCNCHAEHSRQVSKPRQTGGTDFSNGTAATQDSGRSLAGGFASPVVFSALSHGH